MNDGQATTDEVAAIFASNISKIATTVVGEAMLKNALKNGIGLENFAKQLPSNYAELTYLAMDKHSQTSALKVLSELNPIMEDGKKFISQLNDMLNNQLNQTNQKIQSFGLSAHASPEDILNKIVMPTVKAGSSFREKHYPVSLLKRHMAYGLPKMIKITSLIPPHSQLKT